MTKEVDVLARQIEEGEAGVVEQLAALEDVCLVDSTGRTLLDAAIIGNNLAVVELLAEKPRALTFHAPIDESSKSAVKHSVASYGIDFPIAQLETRLEISFGHDLSYGRTPLLTACRTGNDDAIAILLRSGANTTDKDLLGLTAPELCFYHDGEAGLRGFLGAFEASGQKKLSISANLLQEVFPYPDLLQSLLAVAKLGVPAQRLLFCYHCARLDQQAVEKQLADGFDLNKAITTRLNPLEQVCTSELLWQANLPDSDFYAYHLKKHWGPAGSHAISVDNDLINEDGSNLSQLMAEAERKRKALLAEARTLSLDSSAEEALLARRCALIDALLAAGLDITLAEEKLDEEFFGELEEMGLGQLVSHLAQRGFACGDDESDSAPGPMSSTHWELTGETTLSAGLWPLDGNAGLIRLILGDVYGPVDGVGIEVRVFDADGAPVDDWFEVICVREWLDIDGEFVDRATVSEPVYDETPWQAVYEYPLAKDSKAVSLAIRLSCDEDESMNGVLDAWMFASPGPERRD